MRLYTLLFLILACLPVTAATLTVGPGKQYANFCERQTGAIAAAKDGDTILIDASGNYTDDICLIKQNNLTLRGVNGRPNFTISGTSNKGLSGGKGIWVIDGANTIVDNIEFSHTNSLPQTNATGSGIRFEGINILIRNCYFHDNADGILTVRTNIGNVVIEYSEFANNGAGDGQSHNMYINHADSFTLRFCYSHHANRGHLVKTRALVNYILYNRISDDDGNASYEVDIPSGGTSYVIGNVIQQSTASENNIIISYDEEATNSNNPPNPGTQLYVINNTIVNDQSQGIFVKVAASVPAATPAIVQNNIFVGQGDITDPNPAHGPFAMQNNLLNVPASMFVSPGPPNYDYHLLAGAPAIGVGAPPAAGSDFSLAPLFHYVHKSCGETRPQAPGAFAKIDLGAFQYGGAPGLIPAPGTCAKGLPFLSAVRNNADFTPGPVAPGSITAVFGPGLASATMNAPSAPLPTTLAGASMEINGIPAPLFYASAVQLDVQIPYEVPPGDALGVVSVNGTPVAGAIFHVVNVAPKLLVYGADRAVVQNQDSVLNDPSHPAAIGSIVTAYMIGQGANLDQSVVDGQAPGSSLAHVKAPFSATLGGEAATVSFLGLAPTFVGLLQANITIPALAPGDYQLVVTIGGVASNSAIVSVKQ